jgi:oxygen-independent coproporphyrinogen III oxidase
MNEVLSFDVNMIKKYDRYGPRYTSYPTAIQFNSDVNNEIYKEELDKSNQTSKSLSLYFHIPFCQSLCFYCACAKIITKKHERSIPYLERVYKEMQQQARLLSRDRVVDQLHFGGGTPTFLSDQQFEQLFEHINANFSLAPVDGREFSIEIDPRAVRESTIPLLRELGFNRISLGVQDFDAKVQKAVNRIQSVKQTFDVIDLARKVGYKSISVDLIYGLPCQTVKSFEKTLSIVLQKMPDRLSIYSYAHMPQKVRSQRSLNADDLPDAATKLAIFEMTVNYLQQAGYIYIGMDHFALPDDELALAKQNGTLQRNFQGYSTHADSDLIGLGMTSIGKINDCFIQNHSSEEEYFASIDNNGLAVNRGYRLNKDDCIRRDIIQSLMCQNRVNIIELSKHYQINFFDYFANEITELFPMVEDKLITFNIEKITVTTAGQLLLRNIAMVFDAYIKPTFTEDNSQVIFSKMI